MNYTVYAPNGQITKVLGCENIQEQLAPGEAYVEGSFPDNVYYVEDGVPVALPSKINEHCEFDYETKQWVDPRTSETQWVVVRSERRRRLLASDWTDTASAPARLGQELYDQWQTYRQALRDVTGQPDPFNIIWPTPPQG
jgi:hypothetical protein